jgi:hypothetical protein
MSTSQRKPQARGVCADSFCAAPRTSSSIAFRCVLMRLAASHSFQQLVELFLDAGRRILFREPS